MDLVACISFDTLDLQILSNAQPQWRAHAMAVVQDNRPNGRILACNRAALDRGVLPGQRFNQALAFASDLRADIVAQEKRHEVLQAIEAALRQHTPELEISKNWPGVFWLNPQGLRLLYSSAKKWANALSQSLAPLKLIGHLAIGYSKFSTYAYVRGQLDSLDTTTAIRATKLHTHVLPEHTHDTQKLREVALCRLDLQPKTLEELKALGIHYLGELIRLPSSALQARFGKDVRELLAFFHGEIYDPLLVTPEAEPLSRKILLDHCSDDVAQILFYLRRELVGLAEVLAQKSLAIHRIYLSFLLDITAENLPQSARQRIDSITPAAPTLDLVSLLRLIHLRLEAQPLAGPAREIEISIVEGKADIQQLELFLREQQRNQHAALEAFAKIRAELGQNAIFTLSLRDGILPEASQQRTSLHQIASPQPSSQVTPTLTRRIFSSNQPINSPPRRSHHDGWRPFDGCRYTIEDLIGPFTVCGGWWNRIVHRDYYYAYTSQHAWLWIFYDAKRRKWFQQGSVG